MYQGVLEYPILTVCSEQSFDSHDKPMRIHKRLIVIIEGACEFFCKIFEFRLLKFWF
jgi:hypothetical protein